MTWSPKQRTVFLRAATIAGWNDRTRYLAMAHAGCPTDHAAGRPSVKHPGNTNKMFARVMELAESQGGGAVAPPREFASWREAAMHELDRSRDFARQIAAEGVKRLPLKFATERDGARLEHDDAVAAVLHRIVVHCTDKDAPEFSSFRPQTITDCDTGQLYRVTEALKAWVGRELLAAGLRPECFDAPASARRRAAS